MAFSRFRLRIVLSAIMLTAILSGIATAQISGVRAIALASFTPSSPDVVVDFEIDNPSFDGFSTFGIDAPSINDAGQLAFLPRIPTTQRFRAETLVATESFGQIEILASSFRENNIQPDNISLTAVGAPVIGNNGDVAFGGGFVTPENGGLGDPGLFRSSNGIITATALGNAPVAGTPFQYTNDGFSSVDVNDLARYSYTSSIVDDTGEVTNAVFAEPLSGSPRIVARSGQQATATGSTFLGFGDTEINNSGRILFSAALESDGPGGSQTGIFREQEDGQIEAISIGGDLVPDQPIEGARFGNLFINNIRLNDQDDVVFRRQVTDASGSNIGFGVFLQSAGEQLQTISLSGELAPGTEGDFRFGGASSIELSETGELAFASSLVGVETNEPNQFGLFTTRDSEVELVARTGDTTPTSNNEFFTFQELSINRRGQIGFQATLSSSGSFLNDSGIFIFDPLSGLREIATIGDLVDVSEDPATTDLREISFLSLVDGSVNAFDNSRDFFNDRGQVAFLASFTDGTSGLLVSDPISVPEPSTVWVVGAIAILVTSRRRRI